MDPVGDVLDGRSGLERERLRRRSTPSSASRTRISPVSAHTASRNASSDAFVEDRHGHDREVRKRAPRVASIAPGRPRRRGSTARTAGLSMPAAPPRRRTVASSPGSAPARRAVDDRIGRAKDAEQRPATAAIVGGALDQPRDLDELDEDAADPRQRRNRAERRERVVAGLDLDLGQRLEERRLPDVRRPDEGDLGRAFAPDRDRIAVDGARPDAGVLDLGRAATCAGPRTVRSGSRAAPRERLDLADPLAAFFSCQSTLRHLGEGPMRHRHRHLPSTAAGRRGAAQHVGCGERLASVPPLPSTLVRKGRISRSCWRSWRARRPADAGRSGCS